MYAKSLFALAFAFCASTSASADNASFRAQATFAADEGTSSLSVPMPDPSRGMPFGMEVQMVVGLRGTVGVESFSKGKHQAALFNDYGADLSIGKDQFQLAAGGQFAVEHNFGSFDGSRDFRGVSGAFFTLQDASDGQVARIGGKQLAALLNNFDGKQMSFDINGGAASSLIGLDYAAQETRLFLSVQIQVTYLYADKPEAQAANKNPNAGTKPAGTAGQNTPATKPIRKPKAVPVISNKK